jgi:multimeric flavodoxin WrbA
VGRYRVVETPEALDRYRQASAELLAVLDRVVYPALREDPANESGRYPIRYRPGGFTFEIETPGGGLHYLLYQAIEEIGRVLVLDLVTFREP